MIYGRRKGARSWQEHFDSILRREEALQRGFTVESHPKCPTLDHMREAGRVIELQVDDGYGCGIGNDCCHFFFESCRIVDISL